MDPESDSVGTAEARRHIRVAASERTGLGRSFEAYARDWLNAFDAALSGDYGQQRLVSDAAKMSSRLIRDTARLYLLAFEVVTSLVRIPVATMPPEARAESAGWDAKEALSTPIQIAKPGS